MTIRLNPESDLSQVYYRISVAIQPGLKSAVNAHKDYIMSETLTVNLKFRKPVIKSVKIEDTFDGEKVSFGILKA